MKNSRMLSFSLALFVARGGINRKYTFKRRKRKLSNFDFMCPLDRISLSRTFYNEWILLISHTHSHFQNRCYASYLLVTFQLSFRWMNDGAFYLVLHVSSSFEALCHTTYCYNGDSYWPVLFILTFPATSQSLNGLRSYMG